MLTTSVFAVEPTTETVISAEQPVDSTTDPKQPPSFIPQPLQDDWIKLGSGEWLKGEIQVLYDKEFEFDSDDLDMLVIDWEDVVEVYSAQVISVRLVTGEELTGRISMRSGLVRFDRHPGQYPVGNIISMAAGEPVELNFWTGEISLGGSLIYGNVDEQRLDFGLELLRRSNTTELNIEYDSVFRESFGFDLENSHHLFSNLEWFWTHIVYWEVYRLDLYSDKIQNLELRGTIGSGLGFHALDTERASWDLSLSPSAEFTKYKTVEPGGANPEVAPALVFESDWDYELTDDLDLFVLYRATVMQRESGGYHHYFETGFDTELYGDLELDVTLLWERTETTFPDENNLVPEQDDVRFSVALEYGF